MRKTTMRSLCLSLLLATTLILPSASWAGWEWMNPYPTGSDILGIWGSSPSDIYAIGLDGGLVHYDGQSWSRQDIGKEFACPGAGCWQALWGTSSSDIYLVGRTILHFDGTSWTPVENDPESMHTSVWGSSSTDVFVVGNTIAHWDGSAWSTMENPASQMLQGVWGSSASDVFAVGLGGTVLHYNGSAWLPVYSGIQEDLYSVWGTSATNVFAVGSGGAILHYDGSQWNLIQSGVADTLRAIWGRSASDIYVAGTYGMVLHYNGSSWSPMNTTWPDDYILGLWGFQSEGLFACGTLGLLLYYDGTSWIRLDRFTRRFLTDAWSSSPSDIFVVGSGGAIYHYDGTSWTTMNGGSELLVNTGASVWGSSPSNVYTAVANHILHYSGSAWTTTFTAPEDVSFCAIRGISPSNVFAVGWNPSGIGDGGIWHYDGSSWSPMDIPAETPILRAVWVHSSGEAFAVGDRGAILYFNGLSWTSMSNGTFDYFDGVWGSSPEDVFVSGGGVVSHYNGTSWTPMKCTGCSLRGVWGSAANDLFSLGSQSIYHYDGSSWKPCTYPYTGNPWDFWLGLSGSSSSNVYAVGNCGHILHYDGVNHLYAQAMPLDGSTQVGGEISPSGAIPVGHNGEQTFTITAAPGYWISLVHTSDSQPLTPNTSTMTYTFSGVAGDHFIAAYFSPVPSLLSSISIGGPSWIKEGASADFLVTATMSDGTTKTVNATLSEDSPFAEFNGITLTADLVDGDQVVTITASYTEYGITRTDSKQVAILDTVSPATLSLTSPAGGETWLAGSTQSITWTYTNAPERFVKVELLKSGSLFATLSKRTSIGRSGNGAFRWRIPGYLPPGDDYRIRIVSPTDQSVLGLSEGYFSIAGPSITVTLPTEATVWPAGSTQSISWTYEAAQSFTVEIELLEDGQVVSTIAPRARLGSKGNGTYRWRIPQSLESSGQYTVRLTSNIDPSCTSTSSAFSIVGAN